MSKVNDCMGSGQQLRSRVKRKNESGHGNKSLTPRLFTLAFNRLVQLKIALNIVICNVLIKVCSNLHSFVHFHFRKVNLMLACSSEIAWGPWLEVIYVN